MHIHVHLSFFLTRYPSLCTARPNSMNAFGPKHIHIYIHIHIYVHLSVFPSLAYTYTHLYAYAYTCTPIFLSFSNALLCVQPVPIQ